ncbi:hypothetical protein [Magnetospirillum molischianum]|uniref:Uncharacterized protein n=1 Tax=Magnetospirillum molischianum DSM 120 TaxID=1150626 RepID=H8FYE2_MAGML|nr:hypothetical protein [Magnetospirillum molischianum]CCG43380.1 hypothetical protein PHAMO_80171 [Magnetospirillum molischianum DSM 120]
MNDKRNARLERLEKVIAKKLTGSEGGVNALCVELANAIVVSDEVVIERLERELAEAEGALWRVAPNTHTLAPGVPDLFEGPGETYRAAYERVLAERNDFAARLATATEALEDATAALESARHAIIRKMGSTNRAREEALAKARIALADLPARSATMLRVIEAAEYAVNEARDYGEGFERLAAAVRACQEARDA